MRYCQSKTKLIRMQKKRSPSGLLRVKVVRGMRKKVMQRRKKGRGILWGQGVRTGRGASMFKKRESQLAKKV